MAARPYNRAFTLVEVVVVMVVIGILAAIFLPAFLGVEDNAGNATDENLVSNLNIALNSGKTLDVKFDTIAQVKAFLAEGGYLGSALVSEIEGDCFVWDSEINRVLTIDIENDTVKYPTDYVARHNAGNWYSLETDARYPYVEQLAREEFAAFIEDDLDDYSGEYSATELGTMVTVITNSFIADGIAYDKSSVCAAVYDLSGTYPYIGDVVACEYVECQNYEGDVQVLEPPSTTPDVATVQVVAALDTVGTTRNLIKEYMQVKGMVAAGDTVYSEPTGTLEGYIASVLDSDLNAVYPSLRVFPVLTLEGAYTNSELQSVSRIETEPLVS